MLDQQFEELNNKLNSVTDPTGFLRMVSRNNLFNRYVILSNHLIVPMLLLRYICDQQALLRPTFTQKEMKNKGLGKEIHSYCGSSVKESFLHCLASAEAACESSLLNRLSRAKLLKPLSTAYSDGACVCVCVCGACVPDTDTDVVLRCWPCLCLSRFITADFSVSLAAARPQYYSTLLWKVFIYIALTGYVYQIECVHACADVCVWVILPCPRPHLSCSLMRG